MGMGLFDRIELFVWALAQLACYGFAALAALALLTRPRETTGLLLGERGLRAAARVFGPVCAAVSRAGGDAPIGAVAAVQGWADRLASRLLGSRDPTATAAVWEAVARTAAEVPGRSSPVGGKPGE
jgi:hypothetical protein